MQVLGFSGWSGSGKTTLIERLVPRLRGRGLVVSLIKHAHHDFDVDQPGKDSYRHRMAGCAEVMVMSSARWALMSELRGAPELTLDEALGRLSPCDLVLLEGFKTAAVPKIEVYRPSLGKPMLHSADPNIVALATDASVTAAIPVFDLADVEAIAAFVAGRAAGRQAPTRVIASRSERNLP